MSTQKNNRFFLGRRNFILTAFLSPFLIRKLFAANETGQTSPLFSNNENGFVILGGWVLLKDDLFESLG